MSNNNRMFAYGENYYEGCKCPAKAAGVDPLHDGIMLDVTAHYDDYMEDIEGRVAGIAEEETAKKAWLNVIEEVHGEFEEAAKFVADDLGWLNDD